MLVIGLTGGIGSGKSTVAACFERLGVTVVDTDAIAHAVVAPGQPGLAAVVAAFGSGILQADGTLDRAALRRRVFADAQERHRLEAILHPLIRAESDRRLASAGPPYALLMVPLLVETGAQRSGRFARILVVDLPEALQVERVQRRSGLDGAEVRAIMATQASRAERLAAADDVVSNEGPPEALEAAVATLHRRYLELAGAGR